MRTTLAVVILLLLSATGSQAMDPPVIEWEKLFSNTLYDVWETNEGNYIVGSLGSVFLTDSEGDIIWSVTSSAIGWFYSKFQFVLPLSDGGFIAGGVGKELETSSYSIIIIRLTGNGNLIWSQNYGYDEFTEYAYDATELPDGGFAFAARKGADAWILRTDSQGDTLWTREWGWEAYDIAAGILCIDNIITALTRGRLEGDPGGTYIVRYNMDGDLLSEYWIPELIGRYGQDMCEASDGGLLILTNNSPTIVHTDYYGNVDWVCGPYPLGNRFTVAYGWSIDTTMDGGIIYGGENAQQDPRKTVDTEMSGMVNRLDFEGNNLWWDYVYNSGCTHIYSIRQLSQGGYIAAGQAWSLENGTQGILIKYAPETGIESGDLSPTVEITGVSPNPFSSSLSIGCNLPSLMSASLAVYDLGGRIVDVVETGIFPAGEQTVQWIPSAELASGCYLIGLQTDTGNDVRNCVLLGK